MPEFGLPEVADTPEFLTEKVDLPHVATRIRLGAVWGTVDFVPTRFVHRAPPATVVSNTAPTVLTQNHLAHRVRGRWGGGRGGPL